MSRVRSKRNATTELKLLSLLRSARLSGWRRDFPLLGNPDFAFPKSKLAVFVDGCFWHGHGCGRNLKPKRNAAMWHAKIVGNRTRDRRITRKLRAAGWSVVRIWECALAKRPAVCVQRIASARVKFEFWEGIGHGMKAAKPKEYNEALKVWLNPM
jgi:DNA mismatch endonuclease (patch repair protein)